MSPRFPVWPIAFVAIAAGLLEAWLGWRHEADALVIVPLVFATMTAVIVAALALDAILRRAARPDRADIREVVALQRRIDYRLDATEARLTRNERILALAASEPALNAADQALEQAARQLERWIDLAHDLPIWNEAMAAWGDVASRLDPSLAPETTPADESDRRLARDRLPVMQNFSSQDRRLATDYYVGAHRLTAARARLDAYGRALFDALSGSNTASSVNARSPD